MLNSPIDTSEKDAAIARKLDELSVKGFAKFDSDEETRIIDRDMVMLDIINNDFGNDLYLEMTLRPLALSRTLESKTDAKLDELMKEAIEDYYP